MNIITLKSAENVATYLRFLTLKDDWCCYESAGKNQTAAAPAPCSRHYTETFERLFWNILTKNSCRVITSAHRSIPFFSLQVITFAHGFLLCFKSGRVGATTKLLYFMQIKALKNWRCKSSVQEFDETPHCSFCESMQSPRLETSGKPAALEFLHASKTPRGGCDCLKKGIKWDYKYHQISTNLQESNWHSMQSSNYCCLSPSSTTSYNHIQPILQPGAASRLLHWLTFGPFYFDVTLSV